MQFHWPNITFFQHYAKNMQSYCHSQKYAEIIYCIIFPFLGPLWMLWNLTTYRLHFLMMRFCSCAMPTTAWKCRKVVYILSSNSILVRWYLLDFRIIIDRLVWTRCKNVASSKKKVFFLLYHIIFISRRHENLTNIVYYLFDR